MNALPLWVYYISSVAWVVIFIRIGYATARGRVARGLHEESRPVNTGVAALLALLAFILAFTFGLTVSRFETRKGYLIEEVNAVEMTYMSADLLPEPYRASIRAKLRSYVDVRVDMVHHPDDLKELRKAAEGIRRDIWSETKKLSVMPAAQDPYFVTYVSSMSNVYTVANKRVSAGLVNNLPGIMWMVIYLVTAFAMMGFGYNFGVIGKPNWTVFAVVALSYATFICLIIDFDKTSWRGGVIQFSSQSMLDLQERMHSGEL